MWKPRIYVEIKHDISHTHHEQIATNTYGQRQFINYDEMPRAPLIPSSEQWRHGA